MTAAVVRALVVAGCLVGIGTTLALLVTPPEARAVGGFSIVDLPDGAGDDDAGQPLARLQPDAIEALVASEPGVRVARTRRPGARFVLRFDPAARTWTVTLRERAAKVDLARYVVDDRTGGIRSRFVLPVGDYPSRLDSRGAIDLAVADADARERAREWGGIEVLRASARLEGCCWEVDLFDPKRTGEDRGRPVIRVDVHDATAQVTAVWTGIQIPWKMARGNRAAFGGAINDVGLWIALFVAFALVAIDWRRPRTWLTADVVALLALGVSHECFQRGQIDWSVPLAVPPLAWLLVRSWWIFARGLPVQRPARRARTRFGRYVTRRVPTVVIVLLCVALAGVRIGVTIDGGNVIDVGHAGIIGARQELRGDAVWGQMPQDNPRGDTYGPLNYLAYVPATKLLDDVPNNDWAGQAPPATWTAIVADLLCVVLLVVIGWRWISRRGAALLAAGWLACPWTAWALASGVNDALVAAPLLAAFAVLPRASLRGLFVGAAAMVKFAPLVALAPLLHAGVAGRRRQALAAIAGAGVAVALGLAWVVFRIDEGSIGADLHLFWERTLAFQSERGSPFSPWGLYDWPTAQRVAQGLVVLGLVVACVLPRERSAWQVAAGVAGALVAVQLVVTHWFYLYVPWFVGFVLLVLVAARERPVVRPARGDAPDMLAE